MRNRVDILFYCNASAEVGFGHLRRCLFIADALNEADGISCAIGGDLDSHARDLVRSEQPEAPLYGDVEGSWTEGVRAELAVLDYMYDAQDAEFYDRALISSVADLAQRSAVVTSSRTAPSDLPVDVVIGHLLDPMMKSQYELKAGLEYCPVPPEVEQHRSEDINVSKQIERVFIGFGNWGDPIGVKRVIQGLCDCGYAGRIDLLLPAALLPYAEQFDDIGSDQELELHHNIPSVPALLKHADVAFGSYGHMTYEMLALGIPSVVFAVKDFMVEYTRRLEKQDLLVFGGKVTEVAPSQVKKIFGNMTKDYRYRLSRKSIQSVDADGLLRVADEIVSKVPS